jgi:hypothetical protein
MYVFTLNTDTVTVAPLSVPYDIDITANLKANYTICPNYKFYVEMADLSPLNPDVLTYNNATRILTVSNITSIPLTAQTYPVRIFAVFTGTSALNVFDPALEKDTHFE